MNMKLHSKKQPMPIIQVPTILFQYTAIHPKKTTSIAALNLLYTKIPDVSSINSMGTIGMGTHIGDIIEPITGKVIQRIESPTDGIIFSLREHPVVYKGALIARVYGGRKQE